MNIKKENNQYYAVFVESRVVAFINNEDYVMPSIIKDFPFTEEEIEEMTSDAMFIAKMIGGTQATWTGRECSNQSGDIIVDGRVIELKYVSCGNGTYFNSSLAYFSDALGFTSFTDYTHKFICPFLEKYFGSKVYDNFSPVTQEESKSFRHSMPKEYEELTKLDKEMRRKYVSDLYTFLISNPEKLNQFLSEAISKNASNKTIPNELFIFNHATKKYIIFSKEEITKKIKSKEIKNKGLSLVFDEFRVAIAWQNGTGLNNPTFRVFLK
jgi:hypothetical protein